MQLPQLLRGIEVIGITGDPNGEVVSVCYDSRQCRKGGLFAAIPGFKTNGHGFIPDALARGARFIIHEGEFVPPSGITAIRVPDSRRALGLLGKNFFGNPSARICLVGVMGTNGKTTVSYLLEAIFKAAGFPVGVLGTVNYRYGETTLPAPNTTPESFELQRILREMADHGITHVIAEVSSHAVAMRRIDDCSFDLGIFTNLTQDHLDYHVTMENYFQAKKRFFSEVLPAGKSIHPRKMIVNTDDAWGRRILEEVQGGRITYGLETQADITASPFRLSLDGIEATLRLESECIATASPLMGRFNLYNILSASAAAHALGLAGRVIREGIAALACVPGRLEKVGGAGGPAIFVDYAHTEDALRRVIESLSAFKRGRLFTVFGCGGDRDRGKRPRMGDAATTHGDVTIVTSDNPRTEDPLEIIREIEAGIRVPKFTTARDPSSHRNERGYLVIPDRAEAICAAISMAEPTDIVLIAGKGHEDYQIVGARRLPFDDRIIARQALAQLEKGRDGS